MAGRRWIGLVGLTLSLFAPSAVAAAAPTPGVFIFTLPGTHGYGLGVEAGEIRKGEGEVKVFVEGSRGSAIYSAPASITGLRLEADLGSLGKVELEAEPSGRTRTIHSVCSKQPVPYEPVTYVGDFEFEGEGGYTEASATRLPFRPRPLVDATCTFFGELHVGGDGIAGAGLHIGSRGSEPNLTLSARSNGLGRKVEVSAWLRERRGAVGIERFTGGTFGASSFHYDPRLAHASLAPPAPFSGHGTYRRAAAPGMRWTGNLRVDFPGRPGFPVTGPRFRPVLRHGEWQTETRHASPSRPNLPQWPSTKPWPTGFATLSPLGPS